MQALSSFRSFWVLQLSVYAHSREINLIAWTVHWFIDASTQRRRTRLLPFGVTNRVSLVSGGSARGIYLVMSSTLSSIYIANLHPQTDWRPVQTDANTFVVLLRSLVMPTDLATLVAVNTNHGHHHSITAFKAMSRRFWTGGVNITVPGVK